MAGSVEVSGVNERSERPRSSSRSFLPVLGLLALWLGTSWVIIGAALNPILPGGWTAIVVALIASAIPVWRLSLGLRGRSYPSAATRLFIMRPFWYAMLALPLLAIATVVGASVGLPFASSGAAARVALAATAGVLTLVAVAGFVGSRQLVTRRLDVQLPRLPLAFDGLRVVQLSDLHVGPHTPRGFLSRVKDAVEAASPDLIVITGDQVDDFAEDVVPFLAAFGDLRAPLGVFAIAGNHDVYAGWAQVRDGLRAAGMTVLVNEHVALTRGGARLWIAGTGDPAGGAWPREDAASAAPDVRRTLDGIPLGETVLALAHNPALWPALAARGVDLTLSGHTHYGQLAWPSRAWSLASQFLELAMGAHRRGGSLLYINPGTNYWGIPFRLGTPPEVTLLTLHAGSNADAVITAG